MNKNSYYRYVAVIMIILILYTFLSSLHDALGTGFIYLLKFFFYVVHFWSLYWIFYNIACEILAPQPGIEPAPSAREGEVLTTG